MASYRFSYIVDVAYSAKSAGGRRQEAQEAGEREGVVVLERELTVELL